MKFTVNQILEATNAKIIKNNSNGAKYEISTDTRTITPENIYLPLKGENFDGEKFINSALEKGVKAYFTATGEIFDGADVILQVENTLEAYLKIARFYKERISPKTIALTGSSGKTTTKEMLASVCEKAFKTHKTAQNHNNEVGLCQTMLSMPEDTEVLIIEGGMRGPGEIELISMYSVPDITIITNVGTSHIGRLGSRENIAKAKCEIVKFQRQNGVLIAHDDNLIKETVKFAGEQIYYSLKNAEIIEKSVGKTAFRCKNSEYQLNIEGDYNVENAIAVIETALHLSMKPETINEGLKSYAPIDKRWNVLDINGFKVINDAYNANPDSMKAAISTVLDLYPNPVLVLGNMGELGTNEERYHTEIADFIINKTNDVNNVKILTIGALAAKIASKLADNGFFAISFGDNVQAGRYILDNIQNNNTIFLKASRSMKFEEILDVLKGDKL